MLLHQRSFDLHENQFLLHQFYGHKDKTLYAADRVFIQFTSSWHGKNYYRMDEVNFVEGNL